MNTQAPTCAMNTTEIDLERGENGACLDFFTKVVRGCEPSVYIPLFQEAWAENPVIILKTLMNLRDIKGKGEKLIPRVLLFCLKVSKPLVYQELIIKLCEHFGCWKDLLFIMEYSIKYKTAIDFELGLFTYKLQNDVKLLNLDPEAEISLIGKWAPSEKTYYNSKKLLFASKLANHMSLSPKEYRKMLVRLRARINVVESLMTNNKWDQIEFSKIPSKAHLNYRKSFLRDCNVKGVANKVRKGSALEYKEYISSLMEGKENVKEESGFSEQLDLTPNNLFHKAIDSYEIEIVNIGDLVGDLELNVPKILECL
jgi:hypothetical protein